MKTLYFLLTLLFISFSSFSKSKGKINNYNNIKIISKGKSSTIQILNFIRNRNKTINNNKLNHIINIYIEECEIENVNHDIAFAQMCLETNFLLFTGIVNEKQNNFAGIGAINNYISGNNFKTKKNGIRAHIQHLKAYASENLPVNKIIDPRFNYIKRGSCKYVKDLSGKWASDINYGIKIINLIKSLHSY